MPKIPILFIFHIPKTAGQSLRNAFLKKLELNHQYIHLGPYGYTANKAKGLPPITKRKFNQLKNIKVIQGHDLRDSHESLFPEHAINRIIILRDPVKRLLSQYNYAMLINEMRGRSLESFWQWFGNPIDISTLKDMENIEIENLATDDILEISARRYLSSYGPNYMCKYIAMIFGRWDWFELSSKELFSEVFKIIDRFRFIGIMEEINFLYQYVEKQIGTKLSILHDNQKIRRIQQITINERKRIEETNSADIDLYKLIQKRAR